jgi:hypothetical protein
VFFLVKRAGTVQPSLFLPKFSLFFLASWRGHAPTSSRFDVKFGCVADGCRLVKGCIRKWVHGFLNGQPELSTVKKANVKNMEVSL